MKGYVLKSLGLVVVVTAVMLVVLVFAASAGAKVPGAGDGPTETLCPPPSDGSKQEEWCALDRVDRFQDTLEDAGFDLQEGKFAFWDLVKDTCEGKIRDALANNPWPNAYISMYFEPHEGAATPPVDVFWQLREDEAIVLVGQTPPAAAYFSYQSFVAFPPALQGASAYRSAIRSTSGRSTRLAPTASTGRSSSSSPGTARPSGACEQRRGRPAIPTPSSTSRRSHR